MAGTYAQRFADAIAPTLPEDVTVVESYGLVVIERGNASTTFTPSARDRRAAVSLSDVREALEISASRLSRDIPHYREAFQAPARDLVDILRAALKS